MNNKSILMQKQVRDNADDLQKEFFDMKNWEEHMKRKDEELRKGAGDQVTLPPIRTKHENKKNTASRKQTGSDVKSKKIKSFDYSTWDKFDVDKACKELDKEEQSDSESEPMSKEELEKAHAEATKHKNEGNTLVQQQKWSTAISCYSQAIKVFPYDAVFYANRALCQLKLENFYAAESDSSSAIQLDDSYVKAYHRRAMARMNLKQYREAKRDLEKALKLEPSNKEAKSLLSQVESKIKSSETNALKEHIEKSSDESTIEKKIGEKLWSNTTSKVQIKDTKNTKEDKDVKNVNSKSSLESSAADKKEKRNLSIPDWLPEKDTVTVIEPIQKAAHLRSKKSLTKIPIQEVDFNTFRYDKDKIKCKDEPRTTETEKTNTSSSIKKDNNEIQVSEPVKDDIGTIPPVPKTVVQFLKHWETNKSTQFRYHYLKQFSETGISDIFQDLMEPNIFSQIIHVLRAEFVERKKPVFYYLKDLSKVKRFNTLIMFASNNDKDNLKRLFEYCKTTEIPEDEISALKDKYEI
ncbi:RNA polymerase II-associated protein 3 [Ceratina calcarata]|uniref:RNA polymerase II-associated protein 3 n=1 Tax=Ceratina calcarata TaxID=156304 RepID=A0AAJ7N8Z1_9HYME|nr:RNA polymerase II-associated protein 3 [Ceratina calcarata]